MMVKFLYMRSPLSRLREERQPSVLVVDDVQLNLELMEAVFKRAGLVVHSALSADKALDIYSQHPIDLAVLDVMMPGINGFELCRRLKHFSEKEFLPVILITALNDKKNKLTGLEAGADDFISKPFDTQELLTKIRSLLKLKELHDQLDHSEDIIFSLVITMEARDPYTKGHSTRVGDLAGEFGSFLGFPAKDQEVLRKAGILHDIGKMGLSEAILGKPSGLTIEEAEEVKKHPMLGEEICKPLKSLKDVLPGIRHHHERWDGSGFPDNLSGDTIPLMARILSVLDAFDAMVSIRPYRGKRTVEEAVSVMELERLFGQWDPELTGVFIRMMKLMAKGSYTYA
jgi:putative two-component system response regulator